MKEQLNKERLDFLQKEELELNGKLAVNRNEQREINVANWENEHQIKIGDNVQFFDGNKLKTGKLFSFEFLGSKVSYPLVQRFTADDQPGKRFTRVFNLQTLKKI